MKSVWKQSGLSIILLPSGEQGKRLLEVAKLWTELRLLTPAMWISADMLMEGNTKPPLQRALVVGFDKSGQVSEIEVELFDQLSRQELGLVRLLVVRSIQAKSEFDELQNSLVALISEYLTYSLPGQSSTGNPAEPRNKLLKLNLVTAPTELEPDNGTRLSGQIFNANFVAAAEDRSTPYSGDGFVRHEHGSLKFAGHTLMHVATISGIWAGVSSGTYELIRAGVASFGENVFVSRVFLSAVISDGLARRAAARVLARAADANGGVIDLNTQVPISGTYPISDEKADSFIQLLVDKTFSFDNGVLTYHSPEQAAESGARAWAKWWHQITHFLRFSGDKLLAVPKFAWFWLWQKLVDFGNYKFQGGDQGAERFQGPEQHVDALDQSIKDEHARVLEVKLRADQAVISPVPPSPIRSTPELWTKIRSLIFGILDGSNAKDLDLQQIDNRVPIFYRASNVAIDPKETIVVFDPEDPEKSVTLNWSSADVAPEIEAKFVKTIKDLTVAFDSRDREVNALLQREKYIKESIAALTLRSEELAHLAQMAAVNSQKGDAK